jgi:membrane protein implicated in regulation of membrane protease activity
VNFANLLLRITGNNDDAKRSLREVAAEIRRVSNEEARAHVTVAGAEEAKVKIAELERSLTVIGQRSVTAKVKVKVDDSRANLTRLRQELEHALAGGVGARPLTHILGDIELEARKVGRLGGELGRVGSAVVRLGANFGALGEQIATNAVQGVSTFVSGAMEGLKSLGSSAISGLGSLITGVGSAIAGMLPTIALWVAALIVLVPLISALAGVLVALIGSLGAAALGAGALAVAFGGVLLPVIGVLVLAFTRIFKAIQAVNQEKQKAAQRAHQLAQAEKTLAQDEQSAALARKNVQQTLTDAYKAQRDAVDELHNAQLAQKESALGIADASLRLDQARAHLRELKGEAKDAGGIFADLFQKLQDVDFRPSAALAARLQGAIIGTSATTTSQLDIKSAMLELLHAQLGVKEAKQANIDATHRLADAQANENKFAREGVRAYQPYVDALRQVRDAENRVADQKKQIAYLEGQQQRALAQRGKAEVGLAHTLIGLWNSIKRAFEIVLKPIFAGIKVFAQDLKDFLQDPAISGGFRAIGEAIGYVFQQFGRLLQRRDVRRLFADLLRDGARLVRVLGGRVFVDFALILIHIAHAAAPALISLFRAFARWLDRIAHGTGTEAFGKRVEGWVGSFRRWIGVVRALAGLIAAFFGAGRRQGDHFADVIRRQLNLWTRVINQGGGRQKIIDWIKNSAAYIKNDLIPFLKQMYQWLKDILGLWHDVKQLATDVRHPGKAYDEATFHEAPQKIRDAFDRWQNRIGAIDVALRNHPGDAGLLAQRRHAVAMVRHYAQLMNQQQGSYLLTPGFAWGGRIPGWGGYGDDQLIGAEGGEYMVRRSIVQSIGVRAMDMINAGVPLGKVAAAAGGGGGQSIMIDKLILPEPPTGGVPDARYAAVQLARELARRGGSG